MTAMMWVAFAGSLVSLIVGLTAIFNFGAARREAAVQEGKRQKELEQMRLDLERAHEKIRGLETGGQETGKILTEIKTSLKYIEEGIRDVKVRLERHCEGED
jgi:hypothetical protein